MGRFRVHIVGGGIAGLTLAAALDPDRFAVTLHEAQPERRDVGAVLGVWPSARRVLETLGAWDRCAERSVRSPGGALHDLSGRRLVAARSAAGLV
ncbi:FAD-dependent oxidoreductase, partial [Nostocoides japonicum]|uniref:FAD-dependent oxidoreductase n=1 Tax=Nostocoides japonicum TaxID=99481 RepID=UPI00065BA7C8